MDEMLGIDMDVICHKLNITPSAQPIKQKMRPVVTTLAVLIFQEVHKLLDVGLIREVQDLDWIAIMVVVQKSNETWRMCIDFTNLNLACPKDSYPLP